MYVLAYQATITEIWWWWWWWRWWWQLL